MGSLFTKMENINVPGFLGDDESVPFYLQFVPGNVVDVVTSENSLRFIGPSSVNSILAIPHITNKPFNRRSTVTESKV